MVLTIGVACETAAGERRSALTPETCRKLVDAGATVRVQTGLGAGAHLADARYAEAGAELVADAAAAWRDATLVLCVQPPASTMLRTFREGTVLVGLLQPDVDRDRAEAITRGGLVAFPLERLPRTTRAQAMDVLSSQASMAGYKATLIAAGLSPRFFPMLTTAAGTIRPSRVLVLGAGVAGLQAIATARRLGAQVDGFDVRPETHEQIASLGARALDLGVVAVGEGGYARPLTDAERAEQQRRLSEHLARIDVVICTAAVPGRRAPVLLTAEMVRGMQAGSVIVDLAAESGGNCEVTRPGETVDVAGVTVAGPLGLASLGATHASEMYARNVLNFVRLLLRDGGLVLDWRDPLLAQTVWPPRAERVPPG